MTRTQAAALADLRKHGRLWPTGRGRFAVSGTGHPPYSQRTLQALVDHGHAVWVTRPGVMPHIAQAAECDAMADVYAECADALAATLTRVS